MSRFTIRQADELYHVSAWGDDYFRVTDRGTLGVTPTGAGAQIDLLEVVERLREVGVELPAMVRFSQILAHRVDRLNKAFRTALRESGCKGVQYRGVFPVKVNQQREVVQALTRAGRRWAYGLEVGSKAELLAALTMDPNRKSLLIVNGFKDRRFLEAACHATTFKDDVVIVVDEVGELEHLVPIMKSMRKPPLLGLRLKLRSKAPGKWALSGGDRSKFGLNVPEVLYAVETLREAGLLQQLRMLHFHIGSQISDIRRINQGVREAARMHVELVKLGVPLDRIDVGGGLAIDYDGSGSSGHNSANYTIEEYASTVVAQIHDACRDAEVAMPDIITESGRAVVSHHAVLIVSVLRRMPSIQAGPPGPPQDDDPMSLANLHATYDELTAKNAFESFHDAVQHREDLHNLFQLGHLDLPQLARSESLLRAILGKIRSLLEAEGETDSEEYAQANALLCQKLVCNFSLFQSLPDVWGVKQQFPILPLHRLREQPTDVATVADITCDSDGEIRRFIEAAASRTDLPVHEVRPGEPYYLAVPLVGAYQDALGDYHNLFGETNEAWLTSEEDGTWKITSTTAGSRVQDMLSWVRYDPADIRRRLRGRIQRQRDQGQLSADEADRQVARYLELLGSSTYLEPHGNHGLAPRDGERAVARHHGDDKTMDGSPRQSF